MKTLIIAFALLVPVATHAAERQPVTVACTNEPSDTVGNRVCSSLRDYFARSPRYTFHVKDDPGTWSIDLVSMTITGYGTSSAMSYSLTLNLHDGTGMFVTHGVQICGADRARECAEAIAAVADQHISKIIN